MHYADHLYKGFGGENMARSNAFWYRVAIAAVVVGALLGGVGPGSVTTLLAAVAGYAFMPVPGGAGDYIVPVNLCLFVLVGALISSVAASGFSGSRKQEDGGRERRRENHLRALVQNASEVLMVVDESGNILYESPSVEWMLGFDPNERIGENFLKFVHAEDVERTAEFFAGVLGKAGMHPPVEYRVRAADGSVRHVETVCNNLLGDSRRKGHSL